MRERIAERQLAPETLLASIDRVVLHAILDDRNE
jgi:hypothetical protein